MDKIRIKLKHIRNSSDCFTNIMDCTLYNAAKDIFPNICSVGTFSITFKNEAEDLRIDGYYGCSEWIKDKEFAKNNPELSDEYVVREFNIVNHEIRESDITNRYLITL